MFTLIYSTEVRLAVTSQVNYSLQAFWAVSIRELHMSLWRPWTELSEAAKSKNGTIVETSHCQHLAADLRLVLPCNHSFQILFSCLNSPCRGRSSHNEQCITLRSPKPPLVLGAPPRLAYPLVVFLIRDCENDEILHPDETVSCLFICLFDVHVFGDEKIEFQIIIFS